MAEKMAIKCLNFILFTRIIIKQRLKKQQFFACWKLF